MIRIATTLALLCGLSACGSVEIPVQRFYGLTLPQGEDGHSVIATLRVCDLQGMGAFDRDAMCHSTLLKSINATKPQAKQSCGSA